MIRRFEWRFTLINKFQIHRICYMMRCEFCSLINFLKKKKPPDRRFDYSELYFVIVLRGKIFRGQLFQRLSEIIDNLC